MKAEDKVLSIEELVKQESISFAKFTQEKTCQDLNIDNEWVMADTHEKFTDNQIYELYSLTKQTI